MAENLKVTHYNNGYEVPRNTDFDEWENITIGAWGVYPADLDNDS